MYNEMFTKKVLVLGCGNVLFADDGFGPAVAEELLRRGRMPHWAHVEDTGTSVRDILLNIAVLKPRPERIIIVDAVQLPDRAPGELFEMDLDLMPAIKLPDFSFHQFPTTNMLRELRDLCRVDVRIVAVQALDVPETVAEGLTPVVAAAVPRAAEMVESLCCL